MDDGENIGNSEFEGALVLHIPEKESLRSPDDVLARRMKNRERQRRYRARKRHEVDLRKAALADRSTPLPYERMPSEFVSVPVEIEVSQNLTPPDYLTRIHCQRDWKKDARRAHALKNQEGSAVVCTNSGTAVTVGGSAPLVESGVKSDVVSNYSDSLVVDNSATHRLQSNRRNWKAEARNKKGSE